MILKISVSQFYNELPVLEYWQHREQLEARGTVTDEPGHHHASTWREFFVCIFAIIEQFMVLYDVIVIS